MMWRKIWRNIWGNNGPKRSFRAYLLLINTSGHIRNLSVYRAFRDVASLARAQVQGASVIIIIGTRDGVQSQKDAKGGLQSPRRHPSPAIIAARREPIGQALPGEGFGGGERTGQATLRWLRARIR